VDCFPIYDNAGSQIVIVDATENVTLLGAGPVTPDIVNDVLGLAPILVAADGGAVRAVEMGRIPDAVIGDFDSLPAEVRARIPAERLFPISEQDSTDFEKCLRNIRAPLVLAAGFSGARVDHELAAYSALVAQGRPPTIIVGEVDICFAAPRVLELDIAAGTRVSLFPLAQLSGRSRGLRWPIDGIAFAPAGPIGVSNEALGRVTLDFDAPGMLVILPRQTLPAVIAALQDAS
jgi:thiamine pyrophosphokinase